MQILQGNQVAFSVQIHKYSRLCSVTDGKRMSTTVFSEEPLQHILLIFSSSRVFAVWVKQETRPATALNSHLLLGASLSVSISEVKGFARKEVTRKVVVLSKTGEDTQYSFGLDHSASLLTRSA